MSMQKWALEIMDTPSLARYCQELRERIDNQADMIRLGKCDNTYKRKLMAELKTAKAVLKSRQMSFFNKLSVFRGESPCFYSALARLDYLRVSHRITLESP